VKKIILVGFILISFFKINAAAEELSSQKQKEIVADYLYVTGQIDKLHSLSLDEDVSYHQGAPVKCGTPAVMNFVLNYNKIDKTLLKSLGVQLADRPTNTELPDSLDSPSGKFRIHYTTVGKDAVYSGIPNYVNKVADIFDSVYYYLVDTLGYPPPPVDSFYPSGGDAKFDVYLRDLGGNVFGLTYLDSMYIDGPGSQRATSFMELDNDFQEISIYQNRPLDAVRVTCAHEFFHAVQFGIDFTEGETVDGFFSSYWMEMSAVWMEEQQYTNINDYYNYLPYFFDSPWASIQQFKNSLDLHPYGSVLFPLFLSQKYNRDIIRQIWFRCRDLGLGSDFLQAADQIIDSMSSGGDSFASDFSEFTLWNYFTGSRANLAPAGIGYQERNAYVSEFSENPDTGTVAVYNQYPVPMVLGNKNPFNPYHNGAFYLKFDELRTIQYDTTFDSTGGIVGIDSAFTLALALDTSFTFDWGFNIVYDVQKNNTDSIIVDHLSLHDAGTGIFIDILNPRQYRFATLIFTPASSVKTLYDPWSPYYVAYFVQEKGSVDSSLINLPQAIFAPYPNPAVVSRMNEPKVMFKFQVPTDSTSYPIYGQAFSGSDPYLLVDIFDIAGEYICTLNTISRSDGRDGKYWTEWNLKNAKNNEVASGVYIAYARLYSAKNKGKLLAEVKTKVAVIR